MNIKTPLLLFFVLGGVTPPLRGQIFVHEGVRDGDTLRALRGGFGVGVATGPFTLDNGFNFGDPAAFGIEAFLAFNAAAGLALHGGVHRSTHQVSRQVSGVQTTDPVRVDYLYVEPRWRFGHRAGGFGNPGWTFIGVRGLASRWRGSLRNLFLDPTPVVDDGWGGGVTGGLGGTFADRFDVELSALYTVLGLDFQDRGTPAFPADTRLSGRQFAVRLSVGVRLTS